MNSSQIVLRKGLSTNIVQSASRSILSTHGGKLLRPALTVGAISRCQFSTTRTSRIEIFEAPRDLPNIRETKSAWPHVQVTEPQLHSIQVAHRGTRTISDRVALGMVKMLRWGTDLATGYRHDSTKPYIMNEKKWITRFIFLETVAAVPGMTAGMLRHFRSLRRMKRDNGWIEEMISEAFNERMHLLTFMKMAQPGWFMKMAVIAAQGIFANSFFLAYMISPKTCHRFVGYLEEEAVKTYSYAIQDIEAGRLPAWEKLQAPEIAIKYWSMPEGKRTMKDLLLYVRADEAKHREVHHTLGNLDQKEDPNPFMSEYKDDNKPHPNHGLDTLKNEGWERKDVI